MDFMRIFGTLLCLTLFFALELNGLHQPGPGTPSSPASSGKPGQRFFSEITDNELKTYAIIGKEIQQIQMNTLNEIDSLIKHSSLGRNKYRKIAHYQSRVKKEKHPYTNREVEQFKRLHKKIKSIKEQLQQKNREIAKSHGMPMRRFLTITNELQKDEKLYERYKEVKEQIKNLNSK
jgi:hypothetical protein